MRNYLMYNWHKDIDNFDNDMWLLYSPYHDEGTPFEFRLYQRYVDNRVEWYCNHDAELGDNEDFWFDLKTAKEAIEKCYDQCLIDINNS